MPDYFYTTIMILQVQQTFDVLEQLGLQEQVQEQLELWRLVGSYVQKSNTSPAYKEFAAPSLLQHSVATCVRKLHSSNWFPSGTTVQVLSCCVHLQHKRDSFPITLRFRLV